MTVLQTLSRKYLSWVTISRVHRERERKPSRNSMASMSRWLVGSSMMKKSASDASISARATLLTSPPDSSFIFWSGSGSLKLVMYCLTRLSYSQRCSWSRWSVNAVLWLIICSKIPFSGSKSYSCCRNAILMSFRNIIFPPESDLSSPARILSSDVLPVPFGAISAILSPSFMLKHIWSNSTLGPYDFDMFSICR